MLRRKGRGLLLGALLWAALAGGCGPQPPSEPTPLVGASPSQTPIARQEPGAWTLVFYFAADNDLEASQMADLEELTHLPEHPGLRILALVDRSPLGEPSEGYTQRPVANLSNWSHAKLLKVEHDRLVELADWGQLNMAEPQTLRRLLQVAQDSFPAQHVGLFLVDHGQAWAGLCSDESASKAHDLLDLSELQGALSILHSPLDLVVMDACMMATLEVYLTTAPYTRYLIASQDSLPGQGLDYASALRRLQKQPQSSGLTLGKWFLEGYRQSLKDDNIEFSRFQLGLLDSQQAPALKGALETLATSMEGQVAKNWLALAQARACAPSFQAEEGLGAEVHDLGAWLRELQRRLPSETARVRKLDRILSEVLVDQVRGSFRKNCSGISIFLPALQEHLGDDYRLASDGLGRGWFGFLKAYTGAESEIQGKSLLSEVSLGGGQQMDLRARLTGPVARSYTILVKDHCVVGQMTCALAPGSRLLSDFFDGHWLTLQQGPQGPGSTVKGETPTPFGPPPERGIESPTPFRPPPERGIQTPTPFRPPPERGIPVQLEAVDFAGEDSSLAMARMSCQLRRKGTQTAIPVQLFFALQPDDLNRPGLLVGVRRTLGLGGTEIALQSGDQLAFLQRDLRPGGHSDAGPYLTVTDPHQLILVSAPVEPGNYELGFLVVDLQGKIHWSTRPLIWGE